MSICRNTIAEMRMILDAIEAGKPIQYKCVDDGDIGTWTDTIEVAPNFHYHIYRLKPEDKGTRLTNRELSRWLAQGNGELTREDWNGILPLHTSCTKKTENEPVDDCWRIRKWDDTVWHEPTKEYCFGKENENGRA